jgi:retinoid hydroxylase
VSITSNARPPRVDIPEAVWNQADQLGTYIARLALDNGPALTFVPRVGPLAGREVVYLVGPEANRQVLLTQRERFSHDQGWTPVIGEMLGHGLLNMDPPEHTRHRALMNPAFTAAFMATYLPLMHRVIAQRTRRWLARDEIDLLAEAREITFDVAAAALVGFDTGPEVDWLRERFNVLLHGPTYREEAWEEVVEQHLRAQDELRTRLLELIAARRRAPRDGRPTDVLGMLVAARDEQGQALSDEQLLAHVNILLVAGHETTTTLGAWLLSVLAREPAIGARIDAELSHVLGDTDAPLTPEAARNLPLLAAAIREVGRLYPPVLLLPRGVLAPVDLGGYTISPGTPVFLVVAAGHRLPTVFADPERFDPDRFLPPREEDRRQPYGLVTFGGGPRICLGINFAQVEVTALAAHVRRHYRLAPIPGRTITQIGGIVQSLPDGIPARVEPLPAPTPRAGGNGVT